MQTLTPAQAQQIIAAALAHSKTAGDKPMGIAGIELTGLVAG
ncbi:MAG: hypothetical protein U1E04_14870 [Hylemonella sp.]|nr:hypothetical protein [Hylemonella sp.]